MRPLSMRIGTVVPAVFLAVTVYAADPLPSWNEGIAKQAILAFVKDITDPSSKTYVPPNDRIATFDNDGTLWVEQPMYTQLAFALDRVRSLAAEHPEWKTKEPFRAALERDMKALHDAGKRGILELVMATHSGMTPDEFEKIVKDWLASAEHPRFKRPYTECVYQPMIELLKYFREKEFKTFVVSGSGVEFMRPWTEKIYGIPSEQVIGSSAKIRFEMQNGAPALLRLPEIDFIDDKAGKPVGIQKFIGKRPVAAFGNSDGDLEMLQWTTAGQGKRLGMIVHHTDAEREYAYDRQSHFGRLDKALDDAAQWGWIVVDMKKDWKRVFPFEQ